MSRFHKILVANRGEIACRVLRTARDLGYRTVAVYSDADRDALHVRCADEAVHLGPAPVQASYLNAQALLEACRRTGADALHPGYGFLSEQADFAQACADAGIAFIGPSPEAIRLMGSKRQSKLAMLDAGVPCIPGYQGAAQDDVTLLREAERIGLPLMIKASAGGGGRGMRLVHQADQLADALRAARQEARAAFGSDELILERAVLRPRHVEFQVFGDEHGHILHLGERDCSIQRRHQKVVEEAPCPVMTTALRERMGAAAVAAARACNYVGAGTVEFLLDEQGDFYFLEMNTRLQVEHPVTELITGLDLVAWQIRVARGEPLPLTQEQLSLQGHAIEVRLYAEDPAVDFLPQTGSVLAWTPARGEGVRVDHGLRQGQQVSSYYDPMLAKVIAWGPTREDARRRLIRAVEDTVLIGVRDNRQFLSDVLRDPVFAAGEATTAFLAERPIAGTGDDAGTPDWRDWPVAAALAWQAHSRHHSASPSPARTGWTQVLLLACGTQRQHLALRWQGDRLHVSHGDQAWQVQLAPELDWAEVDGLRTPLQVLHEADGFWLVRPGRVLHFQDHTFAPPRATSEGGSGQIRAPMDGAVTDVLCQPGDRVQAGQVLVRMEAMKIEHSLKADLEGTVSQVQVSPGDQVRHRQLLLVLKADDEAGSDTPGDAAPSPE